MKKSNFQKLIEALYEAHDASETVDNYDLNIMNIDSLETWNKMLEDQATALLKLIEICKDQDVILAVQESSKPI